MKEACCAGIILIRAANDTNFIMSCGMKASLPVLAFLLWDSDFSFGIKEGSGCSSSDSSLLQLLHKATLAAVA